MMKGDKMNTEKNLLEKECEICGVWFTASRKTQKYCPECGKHPEREKIRLRKNLQESIYRCGTGRKREEVTCVCRNCGKEFKTYNKVPFCSDSCKIEYAIKSTTCAFCGKKMTDTDDQRYMSGRPWYCSETCKDNYRWKRAIENGEVKTCPECGKPFIEKERTYCSMTCYKKHLAKHGVKRVPQTVKKRCIVCGKVFDCSVDGLMNPVCSRECASILDKRNRKKADSEKKDLSQKKRKEYIESNGLCGICRTSYKDCERLQSNFTASPEGSCFSGSLVIKCPKFTVPKKLPW